ncbi:hypothetical protein [Streptomyces sp. NPDC058683]|uniref:hypothetical protein n=1 Tax=Streptomyces sp. NPDC058683 TaxID=3346597 RepID=UPI0036618428
MRIGKAGAGGRIDWEYGYFLVRAPVTASVTETTVRAGLRRMAEQNNEIAKRITGLGQY